MGGAAGCACSFRSAGLAWQGRHRHYRRVDRIGFRGGWSNVVNHLSRQTMKGALGPVMLNNCFILLMVGGSNLLVGALLQGQLIIRNGFNVLEINFRR